MISLLAKHLASKSVKGPTLPVAIHGCKLQVGSASASGGSPLNIEIELPGTIATSITLDPPFPGPGPSSSSLKLLAEVGV
jgi:hypothetical protein